MLFVDRTRIVSKSGFELANTNNNTGIDYAYYKGIPSSVGMLHPSGARVNR